MEIVEGVTSLRGETALPWYFAVRPGVTISADTPPSPFTTVFELAGTTASHNGDTSVALDSLSVAPRSELESGFPWVTFST